jgi:hypothetical protein
MMVSLMPDVHLVSKEEHKGKREKQIEMFLPDQTKLFNKLSDLEPEGIFYLVYTRQKSEDEINNETKVSFFSALAFQNISGD